MKLKPENITSSGASNARIGISLVAKSRDNFNSMQGDELNLAFTSLRETQEFLLAVYRVSEKSNIRDFFGINKWDPVHFYDFFPRLAEQPKLIGRLFILLCVLELFTKIIDKHLLKIFVGVS